MKSTILATATIITSLSLSAPSVAENLTHLSQLLSTKQCPQCDLSGSGLVMASLSGANLSQANLSQANLSQANLSGANLMGANLAGASLHGANLSGANLVGANLTGTDLRESYLLNANLLGVRLDLAHVQGAVGIPEYAGKPEHFYAWGLAEAKEGNFTIAVDYYNKALSLNPNFAPAYLGRALSRYRLGDETRATEDAQRASELFATQNNPAGYQASEDFIQAMETAREMARKADESLQGGALGGLGNFGSIFQGVSSLLLKFLL